MAQTAKATIKVDIGGLRSSALDIGANNETIGALVSLAWPNGTATSQVNEIWSEGSRSLAASANDAFDLTSLTQLDAAGATVRPAVAFSVVKLVYIRNTSATGSLIVGGGTGAGGASDAWALATGLLSADAATTNVSAGGFLLWTDPAGVAVTNTSADVLNLQGVGATQTYDIIIMGES